MRRLVIGDIHGQFEALADVLLKCKYDPEKDKLFCLGDYVDGGPDSYKVVDYLINHTKNAVFILGNHDFWFRQYMERNMIESDDSYSEYQCWYQQGGKATRRSYARELWKRKKAKTWVPESHFRWFSKLVRYYVEDDMLFVHGGFDPEKPIDKQDQQNLIWDRDLIQLSKCNVKLPYKKVFIGHTSTQHIYGGDQPIIYPNGLVALDTGAGWDGCLTVMDIDTGEYWQSNKGIKENNRLTQRYE